MKCGGLVGSGVVEMFSNLLNQGVGVGVGGWANGLAFST